VEFYVGNASQAAHLYRMAFGFTPIAFSSLETGARDCTSFVLQQNNITLILKRWSMLHRYSPRAGQ